MVLLWQKFLGSTLHFTNLWSQADYLSSKKDAGEVGLPQRANRFMARTLKQQVSIGILLAVNATVGCWMATSASGAIFDRDGNKIPDREVNSNRVNWKMLSSTAGRKYNGVGSLDVNYGVCTAFAIDITNRPQAPAYIVTNGHCQGTAARLPNPKDILVDRPSQSHFIINYFHDFQSERVRIPVKRMVYGTMKDNDIAILELTKTQQELKELGITPLKIDPKPLRKGQPLVVVGIPSEGVTERLKFLHTATCTMGATVHIKEDAYSWSRSLRHNCSIVGGMSGSPMISRRTNRVVGIINTGVNDDAASQPECSINRPCEVSSTGRINTFNRENYGQLVDRIPTCFNEKGIFDLDRSTCQLERPK